MNLLRKYLLSGAAFQAAGEGGAPAPAPAPSPAPAPAPAPSPAPSPAPAPSPPAGDPWYKPFNLDKGASDYLEAKGIKDIGGLLKVTQDFEKVARDRNVVAKPDASDPEKLKAWEGWEQLGWIKEREKYAPKEPARKDGQVYDPAMFKDFVDAAHDERLPPAAAERLYQRMFDTMQARITDMEKTGATERQQAEAALQQNLRGKWGEKYDANSELAKRAMTALGVDKAKAGALEAAMGDLGMVELFHKIGTSLGEDVLAGGNLGGAPALTPQQARAERLKLEGDGEFMKVFNDQRDPRHREFVERRQRLLSAEAAAR